MIHNKNSLKKTNLNKTKNFFNTNYDDLYDKSVNEPDQFWRDQARRLDWISFPKIIQNVSFDAGNVEIRWFEDGKLNVAVNCLDRHLGSIGKNPAIIWEGDNPENNEVISYDELAVRVGRLANAMGSLGIKKGDVVTLYMPMIPEAAVAMLACARIGAVHSVVFGGFSPEALGVRIAESGSCLVITADEGRRGGKIIPLKNNVDSALASEECTSVVSVIVVKVTGGGIDWQGGRDHWYHSLTMNADPYCEPVAMEAEDPLFILYTSGSTGKPKGIMHTSGGYLTFASLTHEAVFNYRKGDVFWCTADVGWITGHSYIIYGPLANGGTTLMFEGVPNYPNFDRFGQVIQKYKVKQFYTAPTAIRALMKKGREVLGTSDLSSLEIIGTVGEPINPEAWQWYHDVFGRGQCEVVDTWWQTETGGVMIVPLPGLENRKPGSAMKPFFGIKPAIVDENGIILEGKAEGNLVITCSWPGQGRSCWGDHKRFESTYFSNFPGVYFAGDGAKRDEDGDYWITGRVDDVMNVSGHRLGSAEIESALVAHPDIAEAAVVSYPHSVKGEAIYVYVTVVDGIEVSEEFKKQLKVWVRKKIGPIATPDVIHWAPNLPKTRSGKIMRRILRKIAHNDLSSLGDTSTLADSSVIDELVANQPK